MLKLGGWSRPSWGRIPSRRTGAARGMGSHGGCNLLSGRHETTRASPAAAFIHPSLFVANETTTRSSARRAGGHDEPLCASEPRPAPPLRRDGGDSARSDATLDAQADVPSTDWPRAQLAFKDSMVRGILQFAPRIAFRCALHRCESRDIHCRESCQYVRRAAPLHPTKTRCRARVFRLLPWRQSAPVWGFSLPSPRPPPDGGSDDGDGCFAATAAAAHFTGSPNRSI